MRIPPPGAFFWLSRTPALHPGRNDAKKPCRMEARAGTRVKFLADVAGPPNPLLDGDGAEACAQLGRRDVNVAEYKAPTAIVKSADERRTVG